MVRKLFNKFENLLNSINLRDSHALIFLSLIAFYIFSFYWKYPSNSDQIAYFYAAEQFGNVEAAHRNLRMGLIFPVKLAQTLFGYSNAAYITIPALTYLLFILGNYYLARKFYDVLTSFLLSVALGINYHILLDAGHLLPDLLATSLYTLSTALLINSNPAKPRLRATQLILSGLLLGWAYLVREFIAVLFPIQIIALWRAKVPLKHFILFWFSAFVMFSVDLFWGYYAYDNALIRLETVFQKKVLPQSAPAPKHQKWLQTKADVFLVIYESLFKRSSSFFMGILFLLATVSCLFKNSLNKLSVLKIWFCFFLFFMIAAGLAPLLSDGDFRVLRIQKIRYWFPIFPVAGVLGLYFIYKKSNIFSTLILVAGIILSISGLSFNRNTSFQDYENFIKAFNFKLKANSRNIDNVYIESSSFRIVPTLLNDFWGNPILSPNTKIIHSKTLPHSGEGKRNLMIVYMPGLRKLKKL